MVKRLTAFLTLLFLLSLTIKANVGEWTLYQSYSNVTYCEVVGDKIYILASGALYSYNTNDNDDFHCGKYLKEKYKGGGHAGAAGCTISEKDFIKVLKNTQL